MFRVMKWTLPVVAFGLLMSLAGARAGAEDAKPAKSEVGSVSGTVVDKDGKPAANAKVRIVHPSAKGDHGHAKPADKPAPQATRAERKAQRLAEKPDKGTKQAPVATGTTDTDGKFTLSDVPAGDYTVIASLPGQGARQNITIAAGETAKVELKLEDRPKKSAGDKKPAASNAQ